MQKQNKAFTLVELIVVITILAVLATVGFISFQGYLSASRDSVRLSEIKNISKAFEINRTKGTSLPMPDKYTEISYSGTVLQYQGELSDSVLSKVKIFDGGEDPKSYMPYTLSINAKKNKFQILGFFENSDSLSFNKEIFADNSNLFYKLFGDDIGIFIEPDTNIPITSVDSSKIIDISSTNENYKVLIDSKLELEGNNTKLTGLITLNENYKSCRDIFNSIDNTVDGYYFINPTGNNRLHVFCYMTSELGALTKVLEYSGNKLDNNILSSGDWYLNEDNYSYLYSMKDITNSNQKYEFLIEAYKGDIKKSLHFNQINSYLENPISNEFYKLGGDIDVFYYSNSLWYGLSLGIFGNSNMASACNLSITYGYAPNGDWWGCVIDNHVGFGTGPIDRSISNTNNIIIWQK